MMVKFLFCPECGTLSFPDPNDWIKCPNHNCGYEGDIKGPDGTGGTITDPRTGKTIDLTSTTSSTKASSLKHLTEVVEETGGRGVLTTGSLMCPKCDCISIYVELRQTRASDEPETKIGTCAECSHIFRDYA
jgi:DNA-directed RNA polymerase subunit M/transcription elongation factor TFIIS